MPPAREREGKKDQAEMKNMEREGEPKR